MNEQVQEFVQLIERPLRYLEDGEGRQLQAVKNLSGHVLKLTRRALAGQLRETETQFFHSLQELFVGYEAASEEDKKGRITNALKLLESFHLKKTSEPDRSYFRPEEHHSPDAKRLKTAQGALEKNVQYVKGVGPAIGAKFGKAGIRTVDELLLFFPTRYEDRRSLLRLKDLKEGTQATVMGEIKFSGVAFYKGLRRRIFEVTLEDGTGTLKLKWFRFGTGSFEQRLKRGNRVIVNGKVKAFRDHLEMHHPDVEVYSGEMDSISFGRVVPIYREIGGLYQKTLRKILYQAVAKYAGERSCAIPPKVCERMDLMPPWRAIRETHSPSILPVVGERSPQERSLSFEELFFYCLSLGLRKQLISASPGIPFAQPTPKFDALRASLPFTLTNAQETVLRTIRRDMESSKPMNRLLQGDVGSGKTIVALLAALVAIDHGYQAVFLAPTEILAEQHLRTLRQFGEQAKICVESLLGRHRTAERKKTLEDLKEGKIHLLVGTHAILEKDVQFRALGLVIVDEQHRFGVRQRQTMRGKGIEPDVLVMSATPIPRTLALTLYGDLDVSILNELPPGRKPIETQIFLEKERKHVYHRIREEIEKGRQAYVVYPLVSASEHLDAKDATTMAETFQKEVFPDLRVGLVHGQMASLEKEKWMEDFGKGEIDVLVSTTVIEVGIDVPNATVMVVEHPERFGLAQLHQLRGRVGRGSDRSSCFLIRPPGISKQAADRLRTFARVHDGFVLAEEDLRLRGPGDFFGTAQSGFPEFQVAVFPRDLDLLEASRREAFALLEEDPKLEGKDHKHLSWLIEKTWASRIKLVRVG